MLSWYRADKNCKLVTLYFYEKLLSGTQGNRSHWLVKVLEVLKSENINLGSRDYVGSFDMVKYVKY